MSAEYGGVDPVESQKRRARNRESSAEILRAEGIPFQTRNAGAHLIVGRTAERAGFDFWPGTGLWRSRSQPSRDHGRGVFKLIAFIRAREGQRSAT